MSFVEIKNASVIYNEGLDNQTVALSNVSLEVYPQEYVMIFGPSGCGKSTLLNLIAGLEKPTAGKVIIEGKNINEMSSDESSRFHCTKIGMVFQSYNLLSSLSVRDNIILPQIFLGNKDFKLRKERADELLLKFGIFEHADKIPTELSGGQQQRIGIARALINNQPIILADEPVGNLDSNSAKKVLEIIQELNEKYKKTIIMVTHNPEHLDFAQRVFYMKDGMVTHIVVNKKSQHAKAVAPQGNQEFNLLLRSFPGLSEAQLNTLIIPFKAKVLSEYLMTSMKIAQIQKLEELVRKRLLGNLVDYEFRIMLDRSIEKGGIGLDERTAVSYSQEIEKIIEGARLLNADMRDDATELNLEEHELKVKLIARYMIRSFAENINDTQRERLENLVSLRLNNKINPEEFDRILDAPLKEEGVGLDKRIVKKIVRDLEVILLIKFGSKDN